MKPTPNLFDAPALLFVSRLKSSRFSVPCNSVIAISQTIAIVIRVFRNDTGPEALPITFHGASLRRANLKKLIRIDVDRQRHVFGERQFVERFAYHPAQAHDRGATH